jgi:hypothetical protein
MIVLPLTSFFGTRWILRTKFQIPANKVDIYSAIAAIVSIYSLIIVYIVYYYREDFKTVFCKKRQVQGVNNNIEMTRMNKEKTS